jgi:carboxymethylenebutenolidase
MPERPRPVETPARQNTTFPSAGATAHGYLALPPSGRGPGVLVIQEWWGLTDHIADVADRLAAEGFVVLAPDLYGGSVAHDSEEAQRMAKDLPVSRGVELLSGAVGFCMGGGFVLYLAAVEPRVGAAVPVYGGLRGELPDFSGLRAHVLGHYGEQDRSIPPRQVEELAETIRRQSGTAPDFRLYPAGHAFFNDRRPSHHPDSAARAWESTVAFLRRLLG